MISSSVVLFVEYFIQLWKNIDKRKEKNNND